MTCGSAPPKSEIYVPWQNNILSKERHHEKFVHEYCYQRHRRKSSRCSPPYDIFKVLPRCTKIPVVRFVIPWTEENISQSSKIWAWHQHSSHGHHNLCRYANRPKEVFGHVVHAKLRQSPHRWRRPCANLGALCRACHARRIISSRRKRFFFFVTSLPAAKPTAQNAQQHCACCVHQFLLQNSTTSSIFACRSHLDQPFTRRRFLAGDNRSAAASIITRCLARVPNRFARQTELVFRRQ